MPDIPDDIMAKARILRSLHVDTAPYAALMATAEALFAERKAARAQAIEEAAKAAEAMKGKTWDGRPSQNPIRNGAAIATAIRALATKERP